jgi:hypothetical protein
MNIFLCAVVRADDGPQCFDVRLPEEPHVGARIRLVLEGLTAPGNVPFKLRVTAAEEEGREVFLASGSVVAISRTMTEARRLPSLRLDVTRTLKGFLERKAGEQKIELCIRAVNRRNAPIRGLKWSVEAVRLEAQRK